MGLASVLKDQRSEILERWIEWTLQVYPQESAARFGREKDRFHNPVGHAVRNGLAVLLDGLLGELPSERIDEALDPIVRIRAVQELAPSTAVGFVFQLDQLFQEAIDRSGAEPPPESERRALRLRVDRLALRAFDHYTKCREEIFRLRLNEIKLLSTGYSSRGASSRRKLANQIDAAVEETTSTEPGKGGCRA